MNVDTDHAVGAIIERNGKYLLIERKHYPLGFACVAGHVQQNETPEEALTREVLEESGLQVVSFKKIHEEFVTWSDCRFHQSHHWFVYRVVVKGTVQLCKDEALSIGWYTKGEMKKLKLEKVWEHFLSL